VDRVANYEESLGHNYGAVAVKAVTKGRTLDFDFIR
jgi:hypothetical protein